MYEKVYFDLAALLILFTIIISLQLRGMTRGRINRMFNSMIVLCIVSSVIDILRYILDGNTAIPSWCKILITVLFFVFRNCSFAAYCFYIISITDMWHKAKSKVQLYSMPVPFIVTALFALSAFFTKVPFYFDENGFFVVGTGIWIFYICNEIYGVYAVVSIFTFRKFIGNKKSLALLSTIIASFTAYLMTQRYPQFHMDMIFCSIGILFVMIVVQNPEVRLDYQSGLVRHATYIFETNRAFESEKPMILLIIDIRNYRELSHMLSYNRISEFIRNIGNRMRIIDEKLKLNSELYYIKDGRFRITFSKLDEETVNKAVTAYNNLFNSQMAFDDTNYELKSVICVVKCPENFNNIDALQEFESSLSEFEVPGTITTASDVLASDEYNVIRHMDSIIEKALLEDGLEVYYQPVKNTKTGKFDTAEALLRLYDGRYGYIYPEKFIAAAEKSGSIHRLGEFVLNEVCSFITTKEFAELSIDYISINLSVLQCLKKDFPDKVNQIVSKYEASPYKICFEVRESSATDFQKVFLDNIETLKKRGYEFALDDFGTGYSNITTFANSSLNIVKFDKEFVNKIYASRHEAIIRNYLELAKDLGKTVVVKGVENIELADRLTEMGCDMIQGFVFSKAVSVNEYIRFIKEHN